MTNPLNTVHRRTYGFLYRLFIHRPLGFKRAHWKCTGAFIAMMGVLYFVHSCLYVLDIHYNDHRKVIVNTDTCNEADLVEAQYRANEEVVKQQIKLMNKLLYSEENDEEAMSKLLPIARQMLERKRPICPFEPPNLIGSLQVNADEETIDEDLKLLQRDFQEHSTTGGSVYLTRNIRSIVGDLLGNSRMEAANNNNKMSADIDSKHWNHSSMAIPLSMESVPVGLLSPKHCYPHRRTAIVIPYRNRYKHLKLFLRHMHSFMQRQEIEYGIYIINLAGSVMFNRAKLLNIGFTEVLRHYGKYDCVIFHDVDLFPENDRNLYTCSSQPKHMSVAVDTFQYQIPYQQIFGGVTAMTPIQFRMVNGYSNTYWGWGGEDDDMFTRTIRSCMSVYRISKNVARYHMAAHSHDKGNEIMSERFNLLKGAFNRQPLDGLSSLRYKVLNRQYNFLYNNITVDIGFPNQLTEDSAEIWQHFTIAGLCILCIFYFLLLSSGKKEEKT